MRNLSVLLCWLLLFGSALAENGQTKVLVTYSDETLLHQLQTVAPGAEIVQVTGDTVMEEIVDADALIGYITPEQIRAGKKLRWVQTMSAGVERVLHLSGGTDLRDSDIILTNNQIVQGPEIADHALAMLLTLTRSIHKFLDHKKEQEWQPGSFSGIELNGRTALVVGVGGIGTQIAFRAWAHGMQVTGVDPEDIPYMPILEKVVKPDQLNEVLPEADVIFVAAPHTPLSHKMFGKEQFAQMKQGAYFICVSRGSLYDLDALTQSLQSGHLAGAGVDVTDPEPLPADHPLWRESNVIITPHVAGRSDKDRLRMIGTIKENLRRFVEGKPLINVVDKQKGY